ncbi:MAG: tetratricopeptide repeat protein, partial [Elusimicrobia bacterium]|nr:tetratricopeptide repeat protein [Elusimicrobiota bacterium]
AFLRGQFEQARRRYRAAAESDGGDPDLWMNLARAQLRLGDEAGAKDSGAKASALDARLAPAVESLLGQTP